MARIKLLVTGDMEKLALHESLKRLFPEQRNGKKVTWDTPQKVQGATSCRLQPLSLKHPPSKPMVTLAIAMIAEVTSGKTGSPADLVVVIDDVELSNLGQEKLVAEHFREAVNVAIANRKNKDIPEAEIRDILRERCSFHLLKPMVESYLFGDLNALGTAGVPRNVHPRLVHPTDVEEFETNDTDWLSTCRLQNKAKEEGGNPWWRHECHPKHYLEYLAQRVDKSYIYEETKHGKDALLTLDWRQVPKVRTDIPIIGSLFEDIAEWFDIPNPIQCQTHPTFYAAGTMDQAKLLLRNLG
ncbi:MAG: hypothetical protein PHE55_18945 [Methylococcaceae bacterium]|nr:hypothetical protein [Methylococcaceae bacterium]